jgi:prophage regulatory protein
MKRLLTRKELRSEKGIPYTRVSLWRLERLGRFPKHINLSPTTVAWVESEIDAWIAEKVSARDVTTPDPHPIKSKPRTAEAAA